MIEPPGAAEPTLAALWDAAGATIGAERQAGLDPAARIGRLAQLLGEQALHCIAATLAGERRAVAQGSADLLQTLVSLWAACDLSPDEIWIELHKREQLGSLLMQLNQAQSQAPRRLLKPWRIDSTKLP